MQGVMACTYNNSAGKVDAGRGLWPMDNQLKLIDDHGTNERPCLKEVGGVFLSMIPKVFLWYPRECTHMYIHSEAICTHK